MFLRNHVAAILSSFDTRLIKVEKSILPLYNASQMLARRGNSTCSSFAPALILESQQLADIESAMLKIDEIKSNQEGIAAEEALILRG